MDKTTPLLQSAALQFASDGVITEIREYGSGNINDTFRVTASGTGEKRFILQRLNRRVFRRPDLIMRNIRVLTDHMRKRLREESPVPGRRWVVPEILRAKDGKDCWIDASGGFWRAMRFIDSAVSFNTVRDIAHAREIGHALAAFHRLLSDLPHGELCDTLEGFHVTPEYLLHYDRIVSKGTPPYVPEIGYSLRCIAEGRGFARVLEQAKSSGTLLLRPIHGDPKVNNLLIDAETGKAVALVDLDTAKPGLVHYDLGDCLRSCCNPLGEAPEKWETVRFEPDLCRAVLEEYLAQGKAFLTPSDYDFLFDAIRLIPFELGLRFFTDYLEGNVYFKAGYPEHNLHRALVQFRLTESVQSQEPAIRAIIRDLR